MKRTIESLIIDLAVEIQEDRSNEIHVTDLVHCIRQAYFRKKYGVRLDLTSAIAILLGQTIHDYVIPYIATKLGMEAEVEIEHMEVKGRADLVGENEVIELKTVNNIPHKPYKSHLEQLNFYMYALKKNKGYIVYISRTNFRVEVFEFYGDFSMFLDTIDKAGILRKALDTEIPPPCNLSLSDQKFYCVRCPYKTECGQLVEW